MSIFDVSDCQPSRSIDGEFKSGNYGQNAMEKACITDPEELRRELTALYLPVV